MEFLALGVVVLIVSGTLVLDTKIEGFFYPDEHFQTGYNISSTQSAFHWTRCGSAASGLSLTLAFISSFIGCISDWGEPERASH